MRLNGNQQQNYCSVFTPAKLPNDTRCDTRRLHVHELLHLPLSVFSDGSRQPCTGGQLQIGNHGDHVHGAGWTVTVIVITIND